MECQHTGLLIGWQVNLKEEITGSYKFYYAPRNNGSNKPTDFDLMGSTDGTNWFLIRNFTKDADGLPVTSTGTFTSEIYDAPATIQSNPNGS